MKHNILLKIFFFTFFLVLTFFAQGQCSFSGIVVDAGSSVPVQDVVVTAYDDAGGVGGVAVTDAIGTFTITGLEDIGYTFHFTKANYHTLSIGPITFNSAEPDYKDIVWPVAIKISLENNVPGPGEDTAPVHGYVTDTDTNDAIQGATVIITAQDATTYATLTDTNGYYTVDVPYGTSVEIAYNAAQYHSKVLSDMYVSSAGLALDVELIPESGTQGQGQVRGYVRTTDDSPINGATVSADDYSTQTNSQGYYTLILPAGDHTLTASVSGYRSRTHTLTIEQNQVYDVDFSLSKKRSGGGGGGGSGSSGTGGSSVTTIPTTIDTTSSYSESQGITIEHKIVIIKNKTTRVIITLTNNGDDVDIPFELREHPPYYIKMSEIDHYTIKPYETISKPLTMVWRFNGLKHGNKIVFAYDIDEVYKTLTAKDFEAVIYYLSALAPEPTTEKVIVNAPAKAFVGDTITITVTEEDGDVVPQQTLIVISPYKNSYNFFTDEKGKVRFTLEMKGTYTYLVLNKELVHDVFTQAIERQTYVPPVTPTSEVNATPQEQGNFIENLMANFGISKSMLPIGILIIVAVILLAVVVLYLTYIFFTGNGKNDYDTGNPDTGGPDAGGPDFVESSLIIEKPAAIKKDITRHAPVKTTKAKPKTKTMLKRTRKIKHKSNVKLK